MRRKLFLVAAVSLVCGTGCVPHAVREGSALGLRSAWSPLLQTWWHLTAGESGLSGLVDTFDHLEGAGELSGLADTFRHFR